MSETLHSRNRVHIVVEMQLGNNAISKSVKVKADTKTNTMRTAVLSGLGLNVIVAVGQHKHIAMNINQRINGTREKRKGEPMTENERKTMMILADTIQGEINRMCVTKELSEFDTMYGHAKKNIEKLSKMIYDARFKTERRTDESNNQTN